MVSKLNPYINFIGENGNNANEQALVDGFVIEAIQQYGVPVKYMPRTLVKEDTLFGEDVLSAFNADAFDIEAYMESVDAFEGDGDLLTSYGVIINDVVKLKFSSTRFLEEAVLAGHAEYKRPREGDLFYLPLSNTIFEIKFVFDEDHFYNSGILPTFLVTGEAFNYSMETIATGDPLIDKVGNLDIPAILTAGIGDNFDLQTESDTIVDFSEDNPFGEF